MSPERLEELADWAELDALPAGRASRDTAAALRQYARVVRVLGRNLTVDRNATCTAYEAVDHGAQEDVWVEGDTPLAALLALADRLEER